MSTWLYLQCAEHNPPLRAYEESGQHLYDLPQIRADLANRDHILAAMNAGMTQGDYFRAHTARFIQDHPSCRIEIWDEYGRQHPLEADDD